MEEKVGIIVCGNSGIDYVSVDYPIDAFRSLLIVDNKEYEDYVDMKAEDFYDIIVKNPDIPLSTSQTSTGYMVEVYEKYKREGFTDIIVISVSSKLSGTYQNTILASEMVDGINIHAIDSKSVSEGEVYLVRNAIEMIKQGVPAKAIAEKLNELRNNVKIYVLVDTLKYLVKNGRLSSASGFLGTLLKIKPLLKVQEDGSLTPFEKIRTTSKARARLLEIVLKDVKDKDVSVFIAHTNNKDEAFEFKKLILDVYPNIEISIVPLTPVVGAHAGPGTLGVGIIENK